MRPRNTLLFASAGLVALGVVPAVLASTGATPVSEPSTLIRLIGRLHPLIIHFPIALVLTAGLLEIARIARRRPESSHTAHVCLMIGAFFAVLAVGSGLANASAESHGSSVENTLWWHKWIAISTTILVVATLSWATLFRNTVNTPRRRIYVGGLLASMAAIATTGHFGGTMVWGEGYILDAFGSAPKPSQPSRPRPAGDDEGAAAMFASVEQIFASRCYECHGPNKQRADMRLDQFDEDWAQKEMYWVIKPGNAAESELVQRISRPDGERGRMPARGGRLTDDQIAQIIAWIDAGAIVK